LFSPGREPDSRSGAVTASTLAIQVAAQIAGSGSPRLLRSLIPGPLSGSFACVLMTGLAAQS
jgi:hypothetical protein